MQDIQNLMIEGFDPEIIAQLQAKEDESKGWQTVFGAYQNNKILSAGVTGIERIGKMDCAIVFVENVRGIIPLEYFGVSRKRDMENFIGHSINFKVVSYDRENEIFTGSRTEAQNQLAEMTLRRIEVGSITPAVVTRVMRDSLFCDIGGIEVKIPIEEIRHGWIDNVFGEYKKGDHLLVKVLNIEEEIKETDIEDENSEETEKVNQKIYKVTVSGKQAQQSPWDAGGIAHRFRKGNLYDGVVSGVQDYGIFVRLADGVDSLTPHLKYENFRKGDKVVVRIRDVDVEKEQVRAKITRKI